MLPSYITGNDNFNDIPTLEGYRNLYQSSNNEYSAVTGKLGTAIVTGAGIACSLFAPCRAARISIPLAIGTSAGSYSLSALKDSTAESVRVIDARIQQLKSGC